MDSENEVTSDIVSRRKRQKKRQQQQQLDLISPSDQLSLDLTDPSAKDSSQSATNQVESSSRSTSKACKITYDIGYQHIDTMLPSQEGYAIFVSGIHPEATQNDIKLAFLPVATSNIGRMSCPLDKKTGYVKGYAFIEFKDETTAKKAIRACNEGLINVLEEQIVASHAFCSLPKDFTEQNRAKRIIKSRLDRPIN
ncbi:MAG: proteasome regulatory particle subunit [Marteilia pararefringens]